MKKHIYKFLVLGVLLFVFPGCSSFIEGFKKGFNKGYEGKPQVMTSTDGAYQLTVPGNWSRQTDLNQEATLQAANPREELYVIVIKEPKSDFPKSATIDTVTNLVKDNAREAITNATFTEPLPTLVNGNFARQFEVGGSVSNIDAKYLYTIVETRQYYYQVMSWTLADRFAENKAKMRDVSNSFKETK
jgi:hypothetical protein